MDERSPQPWPENIERIMELGEGNGYAQPWESTRKGPSLLAELAEQTGKDIDALTPEERIAFRIGWVRGRIRKYEEVGTVDPAEIAHAKENEEFYRKKLREILEKPSPSTSSAPHPSPLPRGEGAPEPTPEPAPEGPSFARYLKDILADPAAPEAVNLLAKFRSPNGRLWVDRKRTSGSVVRIWFSLNLTPEEKSKPDAEFIAIIKGKLAPGGLRFRIDDLSAGHSWKEKWTAKKAGINALVTGIAAAPEAERPAACARIAEALFGTEETAKPGREAFTTLFQQYIARSDGKTDIWTHIRNAYWHADGWRNETDAKNELGGLGISSDSFTPPSYASAKIRIWQKIEEEPRGAEIEGQRAPLFHNGTKYAVETIEKTVIADGAQKGTWYRIGPRWVREEHIRISYKYNNDGMLVEPRQFELMAWQVQQTPPTEGAAPSTTPPPEPKGPATPPKDPPAPATGKKGGPDATPPGGPVLSPPASTPKAAPPKQAPKESRESAEILRRQEVIAIPDIHGDADALFDSLKEAGYVKGNRTGTWELEPGAKTERVILTGDLLDRGPQNLETLDLLLELRKRGANIEIIAGNHDVFIPEALAEELSELGKPSAKIDALTEWIGNDSDDDNGATVLQEVCKKYFAGEAGLSQMIALCKRAHTAAYFALDSGDSTEFRKILSDPLLRKVLQKAQEVFLSEKGPYKPIFDDLKIMTAADDVLYVHAGINGQWVQLMLDAAKDETDPQRRRAKAVQAANSHFKNMMQKPSSFTRSPWKEIIWIRKFYEKMTPQIAKGLQELGFRMVIHGHDREHYAHEAKDAHGMWIVNGDVSMSAGYRGARKAFIRIGKDGTVAAQNGTKKLPKLAQLPTKKPQSGEKYRGLHVWHGDG